jgi:hypothetical protein
MFSPPDQNKNGDGVSLYKYNDASYTPTVMGSEIIEDLKNYPGTDFKNPIDTSQQIITYTLSTSVKGQGKINPSEGKYQEGDSVVLTAINSVTGWKFSSWSGDVPDGISETDNPISIVMDGNKQIQALFIRDCITQTSHTV